MYKQLQGVVFDMDGVIFDSERMIIDCWLEIARRRGLDIDVIERVCILSTGTNRQKTIEIFEEHLGPDFSYWDYKEEVEALFSSRCKNGHPDLKPGVRELLDALKESGLPVALASSTRKEIVVKELEAAGLLSYFDRVVGGDMVSHSKPHPEIFLHACGELGVDPEATIAIEDSHNGIRAAHAAGMRPIMVPDVLKVTKEIKELTEMVLPSLYEVKEYIMSEIKERPVYRERKGTHCIKWDLLKDNYSRDDLLPLWVADMDFEAPKAVKVALHDYVEFGIYGYTFPADNYYGSFMDWEKNHHGYEVEKEWICYTPGVVSGFNWAVQVYSEPGDSVILLSPVYYPFFHAIENNDRKLVASELINEKGIYSIDFADFEQKIVENEVKMFLLCSPHNPVGRVWKKEELCRLMEICMRHDVLVVSDEIHQDFVYGDRKHIPTALAGEVPGVYDKNLVTITAPSKTFNLAGLKNSFLLIPDVQLRNRFKRFARGIRLTGGNTPGYVAAEAAYREGGDWLESVRDIIYGNYRQLKEMLEEALSQVVVTPLEGTYLMWIDLSAYVPAEEIIDFCENRCQIAVDYGTWFRGDCGSHIRVNLATRPENVQELGRRILAALS